MTRRVENLKGVRFGKLVCIRHLFKDPRHRSCWECQCDCGKKTIVRADLLKKRVRSCGCGISESNRKRKGVPLTHGLRYHPLYQVYHKMKDRCYNNTDQAYKNYGGRGIQMCDSWCRSFEAFYCWAISSGYKPKLTIDRIDVNGNYYPENCRWVDRGVQARNKRNNHLLTYNKETHCVARWAAILGISNSTIHARLRKGWNIERVLSKSTRHK